MATFPQDGRARLVRRSLDALADEPVRVLATTNRAVEASSIKAPPNARVVDWVSYSQVMPPASLVICHGGHGTVVRALQAGTPLLCCGSAGDMGENGARVLGGGWPRGAASPRAAGADPVGSAPPPRRAVVPPAGARDRGLGRRQRRATRAAEIIERHLA